MSLSKRSDELWLTRSLGLCAAAVSALIFLIAIYVGRETWPVLKSQAWINFVMAPSWNPTEGLYNLAPMLAASVLSSVLALCLAGPLGFLSAVYSLFYATPRVGRFYRAATGLLAGIPSVVYGFWGLMVLVPLINRWQPPGASLLAGSLILALMIFPTVALIAEATMASTPPEQICAAHALGMTRLGVLRTVVLPGRGRGFLAALVLASGRALGETMAMIMVCGNVVQLPLSIFDPVRTLTANVALEMAYAVGEHRSVLFLSGLLLIALVSVMVVSVAWRGGHRAV